MPSVKLRTVSGDDKGQVELADDVFGIGFVKADQVAQGMGFGVESPERLRAGVNYTLNQLAGEGNTCYPRTLLIETAQKLLGLPHSNWRMTGCDPEGIDLASAAGRARLGFPERAATVAEAGGYLKSFAKEARQRP